MALLHHKTVILLSVLTCLCAAHKDTNVRKMVKQEIMKKCSWDEYDIATLTLFSDMFGTVFQLFTPDPVYFRLSRSHLNSSAISSSVIPP
jgi:hypothetical protein